MKRSQNAVPAEWRKMRLGYVARARIPSEKANSIQVMKMSAAFSSLVGEVELVVPYAATSRRDRSGLWDQYAVAPSFRVTWLRYPHWGPRFDIRGYALACWLYAQVRGFDVVYTRDLWAASLLARGGRSTRIGFEAHDLLEERRYPVWDSLIASWKPSSRLRAVFCISNSLAEAYRGSGAPPDLLHVARDGVDLALFSAALSRRKARAELSLPEEAQLVCHAGQLYPGRGIEETIEAVAGIPGALLLLVGGQAQDITRLRDWAQSRGFDHCVQFVGQVPNGLVPKFLWAADVLVMPYTSRTPTVRFMSPLKMFEYMAAGRPIVATDFPAVREVLRDRFSAILVPPDGVDLLREGIRFALEQSDQASRIAVNAREEVQQYAWERRAIHILERIG
jgi:glycosyltransferase involved in cell wall biosynthesis